MKKLLGLFLIFWIIWSTFASSNSLSIPMSIFWEITHNSSLSGSTLYIFNTWWILLDKQILSSNNYGTNDTNEIDKKINLQKFDGKLRFEIESGNYKYTDIIQTNTWNYDCEDNFIFQENKLCKYNLDLTNAKKLDL